MTIKNFIRTIIIGFILVIITYFLDLESIKQYEKDILNTVGKYDDIFLTKNYDRRYDELCVSNIYNDFYYTNKEIRSSVCVNDNKIDLEIYHDFSGNTLNIHNDLELIYEYDNNDNIFLIEDSIYHLVDKCSIDEDTCKETFDIGTDTLEIKVYNSDSVSNQRDIVIDYHYKKHFN